MSETCKCGGEMEQTLKENYDFSRLLKGPLRVRFAAFPVWRCSQCENEEVTSLDIDTGLTAIAAKLVSSEERLGPGAAKALRRIGRLTQKALADRLGVARETVANWEGAQGAISALNDYAIRGIVAGILLDNEPRSEGEAAAQDALKLAVAYSTKGPHLEESWFKPDETQVINLLAAG